MRSIYRFIINRIKFEKLRLKHFKIFDFLSIFFTNFRHNFLNIFDFEELIIKTLTLNRLLHSNSIARRKLSLSKYRVHTISLEKSSPHGSFFGNTFIIPYKFIIFLSILTMIILPTNSLYVIHIILTCWLRLLFFCKSFNYRLPKT